MGSHPPAGLGAGCLDPGPPRTVLLADPVCGSGEYDTGSRCGLPFSFPDCGWDAAWTHTPGHARPLRSRGPGAVSPRLLWGDPPRRRYLLRAQDLPFVSDDVALGYSGIRLPFPLYDSPSSPSPALPGLRCVKILSLASQASACPSGSNLLCVWLKIGIRFHFLNVRDLLLASPATCISVLSQDSIC